MSAHNLLFEYLILENNMFDVERAPDRMRILSALFFVCMLVLVLCMLFILVPVVSSKGPTPGIIYIAALFPTIMWR